MALRLGLLLIVCQLRENLLLLRLLRLLLLLLLPLRPWRRMRTMLRAGYTRHRRLVES